MSSVTTEDQYKTIVSRLRAFVSDAGASINTLCSDRVYVRRAPDDCVLPYGVILKSPGETDPDDANLREDFDVETIWFGTTQKQAELLADLAEGALLTWQESSATLGLSYGRYVVTRETPPADADPINRNRYATRVVIKCGSWPRRLSDALT